MENFNDSICRWNPVKRFFVPLLAKIPSALWPVTKAKALYLEGDVDKAMKVLAAYPENERARKLYSKLQIIQENDPEERFLTSSTSPLPLRVKGAASLYNIEILSECNLRCCLCPFGSRETLERKPGKMSLEYFIKNSG